MAGRASIDITEVREDSGVLYRHHTVQTVGATKEEARALAQNLMGALRGKSRAFLRRAVSACSSTAEYGTDTETEYFRGYCRFSICPEIAGDWEIAQDAPSQGLGDLLEAMKA